MAARASRNRINLDSTVLFVLLAAGLLAASGQSAHDHAPRSGAPSAGKAGVERTRAGAHATSPAQIPARGWWVVVKRAFAGFNDDRVMTEAAGMTFYTLLALFPAIAALVSIYGLFADPATVTDQLQSLQGIIPGGGMDILKAQLTTVASKGKTALGFGVLVGLLSSLWSSNQGIKSLFDSLNVVYHEREKRSYVRRTLLSLAFTMASIVFIVLALTAIVVVPVVLDFVGFGSWGATLVAALRWPALMVVLAVFLACVYRYGPSRTHARWRWVSWGSGFAVVAWLLASLGFSYYTANFGNYDATYGSVGAVVGFMTWIWISSMIVLLGAELNAELEQQTERDTTIGPEKPMGTRGAFKADVKV